MKTFFMLVLSTLALVHTAPAQSLTLTANPTSAAPGQTVTLTWTLAGAPASLPSALQWAVNPAPPTWTIGAPVAGSAITAAPVIKQINCQLPTCVVWGLNFNTIPPGALASAIVTVPQGAAPGATGTFGLSNVIAASPAGLPVPITSSAPAVVTVIAAAGDLNGDGQITSADVTITLGSVLGATCTPAIDLNHDGKCDALDLQLEVKAWSDAGAKP